MQEADRLHMQFVRAGHKPTQSFPFCFASGVDSVFTPSTLPFYAPCVVQDKKGR